ncbi:type 2 periplasmic-binding domain-containing protein [Kordiimonas aestuarii]|uniref:transporter substrate-binding domain-containing protein n=1 Tax=Kordiimonas aestuarii TaxID=1005925 RepID=UPI0021D144CC|nr:transporter substrate-binding domain-containing protein [Kordiimonas aestuarii]
MKSSVLFFGMLLLMSVSGFADDRPALAVTYYNYPPHLRVIDGKPTGLYAEHIENIADHAGFSVAWQPSSIDEEARMLDDGRRLICTTGRLRTPDRAAVWSFLPYIFDVVPGDVVIAAPDKAEKVRHHGDLVKLVRDDTLIGALLESGIYGEAVDAALANETPRWILRTGKTDLQLLTMVLAGRAHYAIVPEDQWHFATDENPELATLVPIKNIGTIPALPIYIACSRGFSKSTLHALGDAMADLGFTYRPLEKDKNTGH